MCMTKNGPGSTDEIAPSNPDFILDPPLPVSGRSEGPGPFKAVDQLPKLLYHAAVNYPEFAIEAELEGQVFVQVGLDERGRVISASIFSSNTHSILETAALDAAWRCKFRPGKQRTIPVRTLAVIPFTFRLRN
ncbi:energy transducer TonB [bacterium]|nr:energy transducer TonB [bacterium]